MFLRIYDFDFYSYKKIMIDKIISDEIKSIVLFTKYFFNLVNNFFTS